MSHEVALLRTKGPSVFTQCVHTLQDACQKRLILSSDLVVETSQRAKFNLTEYYEILLRFSSIFLWIPWIPNGIPKKYLSIWSTQSVSKIT